MTTKFFRMTISDAPTRELEGRGISRMLINLATGAEKVDVHLNELKAGTGQGQRHFHAKAENVYVVLEGCLEVVIEGESHLLYKDDVGFIPAGIVHTAGNGSADTLCRMLEIYAPAGRDFNVVEGWTRSDA